MTDTDAAPATPRPRTTPNNNVRRRHTTAVQYDDLRYLLNNVAISQGALATGISFFVRDPHGVWWKVMVAALISVVAALPHSVAEFRFRKHRAPLPHPLTWVTLAASAVSLFFLGSAIPGLQGLMSSDLRYSSVGCLTAGLAWAGATLARLLKTGMEHGPHRLEMTLERAVAFLALLAGPIALIFYVMLVIL